MRLSLVMVKKASPWSASSGVKLTVNVAVAPAAISSVVSLPYCVSPMKKRAVRVSAAVPLFVTVTVAV